MVDNFDKFSSSLYSKLELVCDSCKVLKSYSAMRGKLWGAFHKVALCELPAIWDELFLSLGIQCKDYLLSQSTNQKLFEMMLSKHFSTNSKTVSNVTEEVILTKDELNALQYAGGFVPHALLKRYERFGKKYECFFECLGEMAVVSEKNDFLDYTKEWLSKVNRGSLFPLNDTTFMLFTEIEKQTRHFLTCHMLKTSTSQEELQEDVIKKITDNDNVQFQWALISQCIEKKEDACCLLDEIVKLYVTIRGFSVAAMWMEIYKTETKQSTKKSVELRKHLA